MIKPVLSGGRLGAEDLVGVAAPQSLTEMLIRLMMERYKLLDDQLRSEYKAMQGRSNYLKDLNGAMAALRVNRPNDDKAVKDYGGFTTSDGRWMDVFDWLTANGVAIEHSGDHQGVQTDFDAVINNVKAAIDTSNSEGQLELLALQGLLDKRARTIELATNISEKDRKISEAVIGNIR